MTKICDDYYDPFDRMYENLRKIEGTTAALSRMSNALSQISCPKIEERLISSATILTDRLFEYDRLLDGANLALKIAQAEDIGEKIFRGYESAIKLIETPVIGNYLANVENFDNQIIGEMFDTADKISKMFELYQTPSVINNIEKALSQLSRVEMSWLSEKSSFDISEIELEDDGAIIYDGVRYDEEALSEELTSEIQQVKKCSIREKIEELKKKYWVIVMLFWIAITLPQAHEAAEFYSNQIEEIQQILSETNKICYTIKEFSTLRAEPSSKSAKIADISYDTPLEIIEDSPRWYKVKYTSEDDIVVVGWISKISVEFNIWE